MADQEAVLLEAVLDAPHDDAPRLAYAEWCAGQPDEATRARAEFIRGQIQLVREGPAFRSTAAGQRISERILPLEERFGRDWAPPAIAQYAQRQLHVRGFIEYVQLSARNLLTNGGEILASAPVRHLDLTGVREVDERLFASPHLARLISLGLDACGLYSIHIRLLAGSSEIANLRWLSLENNHLDLGAAEALAESPNSRNLKYVGFGGNPVDPTEQMGWDSGALVFLSMPEEGEELERRFGPLPWLHRENGPLSRFDADQ